MKRQQLVLAAASVLSTAALFAQAEVIHAVVAIQREGDRTWRGRPPTQLTALGEAQSFESGAFYRQRYIESTSEHNIAGISQSEYSAEQVYAVSPDQQLLVTTAQAFLQGLYPPKLNLKPVELGNGQTVPDPVNGVQYTSVHTISTLDPNTIWLNADDNCPNHFLQSRSYSASDEWARLLKDTDAFYDTLNEDFLNGVFQNSEIGYHSAYAIYDYLNVGRIHNATIASKLTEGQLLQLKNLADQHEWAMYGRVDDAKPAIVIAGRAMAYKALSQLMANVLTLGTQSKFMLLTSSYDSFLGFFGLAKLSDRSASFMTIPEYASSMVFELFSDGSKTDPYPKEDALKVRFLFKNGTQPLNEWPIFGTATSMSLKAFREKVTEFAIKSHWDWCEMCSSGEPFCPQPTKDLIGDPRETTGNSNADNGDIKKDTSSHGGSRITPTVAGVIGAVVAFVVSLLALGIAIALFGFRFNKRNSRFSLERGFKGGEKLDSEIDLTRLTVPPPATLKL